MINYELLNKVVKEKLELEPSGHDYSHALRVVNNALIISSNLDVDMDIIKVSCYIHDLIDDKLDEIYKLSMSELTELLKNVNCTDAMIEDVYSIITKMSYRKGKTLVSLEGQLVQDADRLDALGAIGIARTFAFGGAHKRKIVDNKKNTLTSVGHFYDKLFKLHDLMNTKNAKKEALKRTDFMVKYIQELKRETGIKEFREEGESNG